MPLSPSLLALLPVASALFAGAPIGRTVHAAVWQGAATTADVAANVARAKSEIAAAAADGVELLLFPELFLHGYDASAAQLRDAALRGPDAPALREIADAASAAGVAVAVPYCEIDRDTSDDEPDGATARLYNSVAVFDVLGALARNYRKVNLWGAWEVDTFSRPGAHERCFEPFDLRLRSGATVSCGCLICFDIEFPEPARCLAARGAELLLVPTALGAGVVDDATPFRVLPTRALENHVRPSLSLSASLLFFESSARLLKYFPPS